MTPLSVKIGGDARPFKRELKSMRGAAQGTAKSISSAFGGIGGALGIGLGVGGAVSGIVSATKEAMTFEKQLAEVSTMLSDTSIMGEYKTALEGMSVEFGQSTQTLAKGLYDILSSGVDAADALDVLRVASRAAIAGVTDTAVAVDGLTTVMNAYSLAADQSGMVSDLMFNTVKEGKITFAELAQNISKLAPIAKAAGVSLRDMFAMIATAVKVEKPERAMTAIAAAMKKAAQNGKPLLEVLKEMQGMSLEQVLGAGYGDEAAKGIFLLAGNYQALTDQLGKAATAAGLTEAAFNKMAETNAMSAARAEQAWNQTKRSLGEAAASSGLMGFLEDQARGLAEIAKGEDALSNFAKAYLETWTPLRFLVDDIVPVENGKAPTQAERDAFTSKTGARIDRKEAEQKAKGANAAREKELAAAADKAKFDAQLSDEVDKEVAAREKAAKIVSDNVSDLDHAIQLQELKNKGLEREAEILDEIYRFEKRNGKLSDEDRKALEERAGKLYDLKKPIEEMDMTETPEWRKERAAGATSLERIGAVLGGGAMTTDMTIQKAMKSLSEKQLKVQEKILEKTGNNLTLTEA